MPCGIWSSNLTSASLGWKWRMWRWIAASPRLLVAVRRPAESRWIGGNEILSAPRRWTPRASPWALLLLRPKQPRLAVVGRDPRRGSADAGRVARGYQHPPGSRFYDSEAI